MPLRIAQLNRLLTRIGNVLKRTATREKAEKFFSMIV